MKIVVCGIGNKSRADDGVGPLVIKHLENIKNENILLLDCGNTPENFIGMIESFKPKKIILIDTVELKNDPGTVKLVDINKIKEQLLSTHKLPISLFINYLQKKLKAELIFIGVQPKNVGFNKKMSLECKKATEKIKLQVLAMLDNE